MKDKKFYREWSQELFLVKENIPIYHENGTISFLSNCWHLQEGIVVLLAPSSKEPYVFCANCGGFITSLEEWHKWDKKYKEIYKDPFRPRIKLTFSTGDLALRSFWGSEPIGELDPVKFSFYYPLKKARGLFRNLGKKITKAMRENEEGNELKEEEDNYDYETNFDFSDMFDLLDIEEKEKT